jgi:hypothetical protein
MRTTQLPTDHRSARLEIRIVDPIPIPELSFMAPKIIDRNVEVLNFRVVFFSCRIGRVQNTVVELVNSTRMKANEGVWGLVGRVSGRAIEI